MAFAFLLLVTICCCGCGCELERSDAVSGKESRSSKFREESIETEGHLIDLAGLLLMLPVKKKESRKEKGYKRVSEIESKYLPKWIRIR